MFTYTVQQDGLTIEELLREDWRLGKKIVHELRMAKAITLQDGTAPLWKEPLAAGTALTFNFTNQPSSYNTVSQCELNIRYEDAHCLIVSKPKGMATHPNDVKDNYTCMNHVMTHIQQNGGNYAEHVHRLDQGTKGLLLVAKHPIAKSVFDRMIEEKTIIRKYAAEVQGNLRTDSGVITAPIGKDRHHNTRRVVSASGQHAVTHYEVVQRFKNSCIVHVVLETGRTHQIRVHMAHLGHPIIGDTLYNARQTASNDYELHAIQLEFHHPFTHEHILIIDK
ncbi:MULTISPECIES: RluA family pseudouridine synthase [Metasolibacillus]|uniref:RluA family pseudouridine synthase n=1 Tax=Metasolibacillus TaxID=2703677 RepID=UPI000D36308B|nr:RluA family pseudouridine synthase [Metasolibacillus fluoroglycofenilyticus]